MAAISGPNIPLDGLVFNMDPASVLSYPARNDPFRDQISLLLDGESLIDKSKNPLTVTVQGSVTVDSSVKKFGNSSLKFAGAKTDYLTISNSTAFSFSGDFTIEFWTYANQWGQHGGFTTYFSNDTLDRFQLAVYPNNANIQLYLNGSLFIQGALSSSIVGRWIHIAVVRSGTSIKIYENGTSIASGTSSYSIPTTLFYIGRQLIRSPIDYAGNLDGYIDDLQVIKAAKYTANFTPPSTPLSLPSRIKDIKNDLVGTFTNGPVYSNVQKGAISFDGSDDYITAPCNFSTGPTTIFTMSLWVNYKSRPTSGAARRSAIYRQTVLNDFECILGFPYTYSSSKMGLEIGKAGVQSQTAYSLNTNNLNQWYHLVGVYKNGSADFYIDGVYQSSVTYNSTVNSATSNSKNFIIGGGIYATSPVTTSDCSVAGIKIYNKAVSSSEIKQIYNAEREKYVEIPKTISGLQLWLDAADLSTLRQNSNGTTAVALSSDPIGYWGDKSGNGRHATQATAGNRPLFYIDSTGPYLNLNGTSSVLTGSIPLTITELTAYAIFSIGSGGYTYARLFTIWDNTSGASAKDWNIADKMILMYKPSASAMGINRNQAAQNTSHSLTYDQNYLFKTQHTGSIGSSQVNNGASQSISWNHNAYYNAFNIGTEPNYAGYLKGKVREIIFFNRSLSSEEDLLIKNYLNKKWGVF